MSKDNLYCPVCKSDSYLNPSIKIYISPCYHKLCESCLNYTYSSGQASCPQCNTILRKINYTSQTFEDLNVEKECRIRKQLSKYLKEEVDFDTKLEYYDYLEMIEDLVIQINEMTEIQFNEVLDNMKKEFKERIIRKKCEDVEVKRRKVFNWLDDIDFTEKRFENVVYLDEFKPKNYYGGFTEDLMARFAYSLVFKRS